MHQRKFSAAIVFAVVALLAANATVLAQQDLAVVTRHAPQLNGEARVEGSIQQLLGENTTLNGGAVVTSDLLVPGTPTLRLNGVPRLGGTIVGTGLF
jgi:rhamnogalacturonan endolyase